MYELHMMYYEFLLTAMAGLSTHITMILKQYGESYSKLYHRIIVQYKIINLTSGNGFAKFCIVHPYYLQLNLHIIEWKPQNAMNNYHPHKK